MTDILDYIKKLFSNDNKYSIEDIILKCKIVGFNDKSYLYDALEELEVKGVIYKNNNEYSLFPKDLYLSSINICNDGTILACVNNNTIAIDVDDLNDALDGDIVTIKLIDKKYVVNNIVRRKDGNVVVMVCHEDDNIILNPKDVILKHKIIIENIKLDSFVDGDLLLVEIGKNLENNCYYGEYLEYLGHVCDPNADLQIIAKENNIDLKFSQQAMDEAIAIPSEVSNEEIIGRLDLTKELIFSIDCKNTKDKDDAISLHLDKEGNYILGVHIADVSHYVHPGMKLWEEAMDRSTSVYLANTVIPMLPRKLSNGICSLNPNVKRLTFSCIAKISPKGDILDYQFVDSVIESKLCLTYEEATDIIEGRNKNYDYNLFLTLRLMNQLSNILEKAKNKRGVIDFGDNDVIIEFDENDKPIDLSLRVRNKAELLIANFMQVASQCAAQYVSSPAPFRVHDKPAFEDMQDALYTLSHKGIRVTDIDDIVDSKAIQNVLKRIRNESSRDIAANIFLKAMKPARYSARNVGHFALSLDKYAQFTSPIRRAPDLLLHVIMKNEKDLNNSTCFSPQDVNRFCIHATKKEASAVIAQRQALLYETKKYLEDHYEEKFDAIVTFVYPSGIFIKTSQGIEGKIYADDIEGEEFRFDYYNNVYKSKRQGYVIDIGTRLLLTPLDVYGENKMISFSIKDEDLMVLKKRN